MRAAWLGLGNFGMPIARRLEADQHRVYPVTFDGHGAAAAESFIGSAGPYCEAVDGAGDLTGFDALVVCLPRAEDVVSFVTADVSRLPPVIVDLTTGTPFASRRLFDMLDHTGRFYIDCPVSGSPTTAADGYLTVFAGGRRQTTKEAAHAVLHSIAGNIAWLGNPGTGMAGKLVNQLMHLTIVGVIGEAFDVGQSMGLNLHALLPALRTASGSSAMLQRFGEDILAGDFDPHFTLDLALKDLGIVADAAGSVDMPYTTLTAAVYETAQVDGRGAENFTTVCRREPCSDESS